MYVIHINLKQTNLALNHYAYMKFPSFYDLVDMMWSSDVNQPANLVEPVQTHGSCLYIEKKLTILPSQLKEQSDLWYCLKVNQFFSHNPSLRFQIAQLPCYTS